MAITILINGAFGKMGQETTQAIQATQDLTLIAQLGKQDDLRATLLSLQPQVAIDFTNPHVVYDNVRTIIDCGVRPIVGTTGLSFEQIQHLKKQCAINHLGGIIAPNFSIAAILMMRYAKDCIRHLPYAEIIEFHHEKKQDAPSGTAIKTAELMHESREKTASDLPPGKEILAGARGADCQGIPIHSIRLPGLLAHQEVIFGNEGETFILRHDTLNRQAFMPGVLLACRKILTLQELVYGLEHLLLS